MLKNEKGFTIVEIVLVMAITVLLLIPISSLLISNTRSVIFTNDKVDVHEKAMNIMAGFRTDCTYAKEIKSLTVDGYNYLYDNVIPDNSSYEMTIIRPSLSSGYKETVYAYDAVNKEFKINGTPLSKDVVVDIIPLFTASTPPSDRTFENAVGITVNVSISRENVAIRRTATVDDLSNTFFFRNSGVDFASVDLEDAEGSAAPTPIPVPTYNPTSTPSSTPDDDDDNENGDSGDNGDNDDNGDSGNGGSNGDNGGGSAPGGNIGIIPDNTSSPEPTTAPTPTPTPSPTPSPTVTPTEPPETGIGMTINYDGSTCTIYDKNGNARYTYNGGLDGKIFTFNPWYTSLDSISSWNNISDADYEAFGLMPKDSANINIAFIGSGTGTLTVKIQHNFPNVNIINASGCTIMVNNESCSNVYVTGSSNTNYQVESGTIYELKP